MTTLTATPDTITGSVLLVIDHDTAVTRVLRNDANGIHEVRALDGQYPTPAAGTLLLTDYEAAAGNATYTVLDGGSGASATATLVIDRPWLLVPVLPNFSVQVHTISGYSPSRSAGSTVHRIVGRPDPLISYAPMGYRDGTLEIYCTSLAAAVAVEDVFTHQEAVQLKQNVPGMDMYFTGTATGISADVPMGELTCYVLSVSFTEIRRPDGPLAGALGWTFDEVTAGYSSFDELQLVFADFDALTIRDAT